MTTLTKATAMHERYWDVNQRLYPLYLIYSLFYFFPLLFMADFLATVGLGWWSAMLAIYALFVALFFAVSYWQPPLQTGALVSMLALATLGTAVSPGTAALYAYVTFFAVFHFPTRRALAFCVATGLSIVLAAWVFVDFAWYFVGPAFFAAAMNIFTASLEVQKRKLHAESERASHLEERERMAHDLHDVTGHQLTAIALKAQLAIKQLAAQNYTQAALELDAISALAAQNRIAIRNAIEGKLPDNVQVVYPQLIALLTEQGFDVKTTGALPEFKPTVSGDIVAIYTEAITNALRHSADKRVLIIHAVTAGGYQWRIANACGADGSITPSDGAPKSSRVGLGLASMAKRAQNMGGCAAFSVGAAGQAELCLTLPLTVLLAEH